MPEPKTKLNDASVNAFLDKVGDDQRRADCFAVADLMKKVTRQEPKMWGSAIVGFGSYLYKYASGREGDWPIVAFSPRKQNLVLYIMSCFKKCGGLMKKLGKHKTGGSCLYINKLADIDQTVLKELVKGSVAFMKKKYKN